MDPSAHATSRPALAGSARAFVLARRKRRQGLQAAPELRWESRLEAASGSGHVPDGTPVWSLRLLNGGDGASAARVVLFTPELVAREAIGTDGAIDAGEAWAITFDAIEGQAASPLRGYVLAFGADGRWHATTLDGRTASFRTRPDELGVMRTLGLRMPLGLPAHEGPLEIARVTG